MVMNSTRAVAVSIQAVFAGLMAAPLSSSAWEITGTQDNRMPCDRRRMVLLSMEIPLKDLFVYCLLKKRKSECGDALFPGADANDLFQPGHKDLAVADFSRVGRTGNRTDGVVHLIGTQCQLQFQLGHEIDHVFRPPVQFGVAFLPAKPFHFLNRHAVYPHIGQGFPDIIELKRLDDCRDHSHNCAPLILLFGLYFLNQSGAPAPNKSMQNPGQPLNSNTFNKLEFSGLKRATQLHFFGALESCMCTFCGQTNPPLPDTNNLPRPGYAG